MKHLVYIALLAILTVTAFADNSNNDSPAAIDLNATDSLLTADSVITMTTDSAAATPAAQSAHPQRKRRITAVDNAATRTQHVNDAQGDSARMIERRKQRSIHYHDENGNTIMVDTVTGQEWIDSTLLPPPPKMKQPLMYAVEVGVNIWDPVMRAFGQKYGGVDFSAALNLHNRYIPTFEAGFGMAKKTPATMNYTYSSPMAPYFKLGADYNFIYNSDPAYRFVAGVRYGFSAFSYKIEDVTFKDNYWGENGSISFPSQNVTAGWFELVLGLRVKIAGPISAGWMFRYHSLLHQSKPPTGNAWYIPGFGPSTSSFTGSFSIVYTLNLGKKHSVHDPAKDVGTNVDTMIKNE